MTREPDTAIHGMAAKVAAPPAITSLTRVAVIGNSEPRRCGLATFTSHCVTALGAAYPDLRVDHYAIRGIDDDSAYPPHVHLIDQEAIADYAAAARDIVDGGAQCVWINHEFGIFGGDAGEYICHLVDRLTVPVLVTFHTVLEHPNEQQERIVRALCRRSDRIMVMAHYAAGVLIRRYGVEPSRIMVVPHGVPDRAYVEPSTRKAAFDAAGRPVLLTFGLLAPDKGIGDMIAALPAIVSEHPNVLYIVLGATHPNIKREHGEKLRDNLIAQADQLNVSDNIRFIDCFVEQEDLLDYLQASDVYITPYLNPAQITSGTLSYAIAMGKPVVATPYIHATEAVTDTVGRIVPFGDPVALSAACNEILSDRGLRSAMANQSYALGRTMLWPRLADAVVSSMQSAQAGQPARLTTRRRIPKPDPRAVLMMSDNVGIMQHGVFQIADRSHGYCTDDNARALILMCTTDACPPDTRIRAGRNYAAFLQHAWNPDCQRFRNFMSYDRRWLEDRGSEDSSARALWALGVASAATHDPALSEWARNLLCHALPSAIEYTSPRAMAFAVLGATQAPPSSVATDVVTSHAATLRALFAAQRRPDWPWFEAVLAYDNCRVPEAMIRAGQMLGDGALVDLGLETLRWMVDQQKAPSGHFRGVGNESFGRVHAAPLPFDQQPVEAAATVDACVLAYQISRDPRWIAEAEQAFAWFYGDNDLGVSLVDPITGACHDGLTPFGPNRNSGAESLLSLQLAAVGLIKVLNVGVELPPVSVAS